MVKKKPIKKDTTKPKTLAKIGSEQFAKDVMGTIRAAFETIADTYSPHDKNKILEHCAISALVPTDIKKTIEVSGIELGHKEKVATAIIGNAKLLISLTANILQELAKKYAEDHGTNYANSLTFIMGKIMEQASMMTSESEEAIATDEGLRNKTTAKTFADMVKDLSAEDISNLLG